MFTIELNGMVYEFNEDRLLEITDLLDEACDSSYSA